MLLEFRPILADGPPDPEPEPVVATAHHDLAVLTGVDRVNVDGEIPVAVPGPDTAVHPVPPPVVIEDADDAGRGGPLDKLASARDPLPVVERRHDSNGRAGPADLVAHPPAGSGGGSTESHRSAGAVHKAAGGLGSRIEIVRLVLQGPPLAELADPTVDQPGVELAELPVADPPLIKLAGGGVLDEYVGVHGKFLEDFAPLGLGEVQRDGLLAPGLCQEAGAYLLARLCILEHVLFPPPGGELAQRITSGRFHHDDLGPQL